jgi:hypothetical protein
MVGRTLCPTVVGRSLAFPWDGWCLNKKVHLPEGTSEKGASSEGRKQPGS